MSVTEFSGPADSTLAVTVTGLPGFGTAGQQLSENYFSLQNGKWQSVYEKLDLEQVYVDSIIGFSSEMQLK